MPDLALVHCTNVITVIATDGANSGGDVLTVARFHATVVYCTGDGSGRTAARAVPSATANAAWADR